MLLSVCYVAVPRVLQLIFLLFRSAECKELEIVVLRHDNLVRKAWDRALPGDLAAAAGRLINSLAAESLARAAGSLK